jgi:DNA repair exonuclease SbcCD ATPase subunit
VRLIHLHLGWLGLSWVAIACLAGVLAVGQAAVAAEASPATPGRSPAASTGDEKHVAQGEVRFANQWVPVDALFKDYQAARAEVPDLNSQVDAKRVRMAELQRQLNEMKNQSTVQERPIRIEIPKAKAKQREYQKILNAKAPTPPQLLSMPPQPAQTNYTNRLGGGNTTDPQDEWRRRCDAIRAQNEQLMQKFKQEQDAYKKAQDEAKKEMPKVLATIKQGEDQLKKFAADLEAQQAPHATAFKDVSGKLGALLRQITALETRIQDMAAAMRTAPETVRSARGIVEWEGVFYPLADLQKLYTETQTEIDRVNLQMKAEAEAAGRPLPANWRHPQQDRMDALKALLNRVQPARGDKPAA